MSRGFTSNVILLGALVVQGAGCDQADKMFCGTASCEYTADEWDAITALANLPPEPPVDRSNKYYHDAGAEKLGQKFFFDSRFSGLSLQTDTIRRPVTYGRAPKGQPINVSCASCHNMSHAAIDTESVPGNLSVGAAWTPANSPTLFNVSYYGIMFWSGHGDSLWAQSVGSNEGQSSNGNRMATAWTIQDLPAYLAEYNEVFKDTPLPLSGTSAAVKMLLDTTDPKRVGQCKLSPGCPEGCRAVQDEMDTSAVGCFPRFPLNGKPGSKPGCQPGDAKEPFGDAFDCMAKDDRDAMTQMLVNWAKAIAAYEYRLVSRDSAFDRYVATIRAGVGGEQASAMTHFSSGASRGARLFVGKAACVECHNTPLFSDSKFHNVGTPQVGPGVITEADCPAGGVCDCVGTPDRGPTNCIPWGGRDGLAKLKKNAYRRDGVWSDDRTDNSRQFYYDIPVEPPAPGTPRMAGIELDADGAVRKGSYKTPGLRDVALTAPYMHNGVLTTLEQVVAHYNQGGSGSTVGSRSAQMKPLFLSPSEQADLVEFLKTLNGAQLPATLLTAPALP